METYYFDNSATSCPKPEEVYKAVEAGIKDYNANPGRAGHRKALESGKKIYEVREKIAKFFNIENSLNIAFTANATESLNFAIKGGIPTGSHVITTNFEHNSVLRPLFYMQDEKEVSLTFVNTYKEIEENIKSSTKAIVVNHISNVNGTVQDIEKIGKICKKYNLLFILDASQSAGYIDIDMERDNIDILCLTGHKSLFGIQGIGAICLKEGVKIIPVLEGGTGSFSKLSRQPKEMPELLEAGTPNTPGILSLGAGIDFINRIGLNKIKEHEDILTKRFIKRLRNIDKIKLYESFTENQGPVISLNIEGIESSDLAQILDEEFGILVRAGYHCAPLAHRTMGTYETGTVRFSFGYFNTEEEIDYALDALKNITLQI
ncbi:aminotransferase class V-fold PLP-dependent enzyme [Candidatus Cetobacterium colombiensis]|jgi:cysteine desulfurase family protein|uniref:cysteine desulfurase n=1 Tax=Candidatus Cetobacterium colombiensis TaxID=3073100 RepID=A0ABU4W8G5_9FUSO|nr:aminotransferase class V-fold PLP-dependent enzyme [Candidatus Cetobacterium colombiensis]MDX8335802.1 aminotransferase class V-fold PLP-dependent enzyme [Candidatus Cetobacterium colombiensis]